MKTIIALAFSAVLAAAVAPNPLAAVAQGGRDMSARVDQIFARWNSSSTPGCAVGTSVKGQTALENAYGMADLEHDVKITPETIFEAG